MCGLQDSLWSKMTPRNFAVFSIVIWWLFILILSLGILFLLVKRTPVVLVMEILNPFSSLQVFILSSAHCILSWRFCMSGPAANIALSSAKRVRSTLFILVFKSFLIMMNSIGDIILPCGVPFSCLSLSDRADPTLTWKDLLPKKFVIQLSMCPWTPMFFSLFMRVQHVVCPFEIYK